MPRNPFPVRKTVYLSLTCLCFLLGLCRALLVLVQRDGAMPFLFCLIVSSLALGSCALLGWKAPKPVPNWTVPAVLAALITLLLNQPLLHGGAGFANYCISWWNLAYDDALPRLSLSADRTDLNLFLLWLLLILAVLVWHTAADGGVVRAVAVTFVCALVTIGLKRFDPLAFALLCSGVSGLWLYRLSGNDCRAQLDWLVRFTAVTVALALVLSGGTLQWIDAARANTVQAVHTLCYGSDSLPEGDLRHAEKMQTGTDTVLTVRTQQQKNVYLRGYVGGRYEDGVWKPPARSAYAGEYTGLFSWLEGQNLQPVSQYGAFLAAGQETEPAENIISVENVSADRSRLCLPYSLLSLTDQSLTGQKDGAIRAPGILGLRSYRFSERSGSLPGELLQQPDWLTRPQTQAEQDYLQTESVYRAFVYDTYLDVDPGLSDLIAQVFDPNGDAPEGLYAATQRIRTALKNQTVYHAHPASVPENAEPIRWFLTQGEGNSALFSATAVLAYRSFGIPARYAEGYLLPQSRTAAGELVPLSGEDAHAWVEIYLDGMGWVPVDVTPGFYLDAYMLRQLAEHPQQVQRTVSLSDDDASIQSQPQRPSSPPKQDTEQAPSPLPQLLLGGGLALLILVLALLFLLEALCWLALLRRLRAYQWVKSAARGLWLCQWIARMLQIVDPGLRLGWETQATEDRLRTQLPILRPGEYTRVAALMEKCIYSQQPLPAYEVRTMLYFAEKIWTQRTGLSPAKLARIRLTALAPLPGKA